MPAPQGVERRKRKCHWRKVAEEKGGPASDENGSLEIRGEGGREERERKSLHSPLSASFPPSFLHDTCVETLFAGARRSSVQSRRHFPNAHFVSGSGERYGGRTEELARHMCVRSVLGPSHEFSAGEGPGGGGKRRGEPRLQQVLAGGGGGGERVRSPGRKKIPSSAVSSTRFGAPFPPVSSLG